MKEILITLLAVFFFFLSVYFLILTMSVSLWFFVLFVVSTLAFHVIAGWDL